MTPHLYARLAGTVDVPQLCLIVFALFFAAIVYYNRREDKREGYPLVDPAGGHPIIGFPAPPPPKTYLLMHTNPETLPHPEGRVDLALTPLHPWPGSPYAPTGDAMQDGVGPASWASKKDEPLLTWEGHHTLTPLRIRPDWGVVKDDPDPRGMTVLDAAGAPVGTVVDLWLDHDAKILRYLEIGLSLPDSVPRAIVPIYYADIYHRLRQVRVAALFAPHFARFPQLREADSITAREEDRVASYCQGGLMYAKPSRSEAAR